MGSITGLDDAVLADVIAEAVQETGNPLQVANYLFPGGRVVSGAIPAVDVACAKAKERGAQASLSRSIQTPSFIMSETEAFQFVSALSRSHDHLFPVRSTTW